jgi:hypothetical protein
VHAHPELLGDRPGQAGGFQCRIARQLLLGPGQDLPGELVAAAGPGLAGTRPTSPEAASAAAAW